MTWTLWEDDVKLPTKLYVCWDDQSDDEPMLLAHEEWERLAEADKVKVVGAYQLVDELEVELKPVSNVSRRKRNTRHAD